jgi:hypothetical protein
MKGGPAGDVRGRRVRDEVPVDLLEDHGRLSALSTDGVRDVIWRLVGVGRVVRGRADAAPLPGVVRDPPGRRNRDLAAVQDLLGRESADTTRVYTKVAAQRLADVHRRAFGRGDASGT